MSILQQNCKGFVLFYGSPIYFKVCYGIVSSIYKNAWFNDDLDLIDNSKKISFKIFTPPSIN